MGWGLGEKKLHPLSPICGRGTGKAVSLTQSWASPLHVPLRSPRRVQK